MDTTAIGITPLRLPSVSFNPAGAAFDAIRSTHRQVQRRVDLGHILPAPGRMCPSRGRIFHHEQSGWKYTTN